MKPTIGFVGAGNMGQAIIRGMLARKVYSPSQICVYDVLKSKARGVARALRVHALEHPKELVQKADILLLAVKPQNLSQTASALAPYFMVPPQLISILAGVPIRAIKKRLGQKAAVVRAMPNLAATVGQSCTAITGDKRLLSEARTIFETCGIVLELPEEKFHAVTALSGSGPAYYFFLMELAMIEAKKYGFSPKEARRLAVQTAKGAALLAQSAQENPEELRKQVTSKGGTTEAALQVLFKRKFPQIFSMAIDAAVQRGKQLEKAV
ncbi:MAG: pyrroline-5-carboxylate reductase [Candidatus Omnitrophica bacterium]|nr:pyrroline-5-carboxylate reductase [Candidatus Omnitrophota bacterium]